MDNGTGSANPDTNTNLSDGLSTILVTISTAILTGRLATTLVTLGGSPAHQAFSHPEITSPSSRSTIG